MHGNGWWKIMTIYGNNIIIDDWESIFVAIEFLVSIDHVLDSSAENAARDGFAMDNPDDDDNTADDLSFVSLGIVDANTIAEITYITTLNRLTQLDGGVIANVVTSSKIINQYDYGTYFISMFPTLFLMIPETIEM
jgi:hypothetical protein